MAITGRMSIGPFEKAGINGCYIYIDWKAVANITSNMSVVSVDLILACESTTAHRISATIPSTIPVNVSSSDYWVILNGKKYYFTPSTSSLNDYSGSGVIGAIKIGSITSSSIPHNNDGTKTTTLGCSFPIYFKNLDTGKEVVSIFTFDPESIPLETITRQAKITAAPNFNDESNPLIKYLNPLGNEASSINVCITDENNMIVVHYREVSAVGTEYRFELTDAERRTLRALAKTSTTTTVKFFIQTVYNEKTYYHNVSRTLTIINAEPVITSASVVDTNQSTINLTGNPNKLVRYMSIAEADFTAEGQKGAVVSLDTMLIKNGSNTAFHFPGVFENVESNVFIFSAEDSRGASSSLTLTPEMVEYVRLTCNIDRGELDANGGLLVDVSGNYFNGSFGNYDNTLTVQMRYKTQDGEYGNWYEMEAYAYNSNTYDASITIPDLNYREKYIIQCRVIDRLSDTETAEMTIKSFPVFHWSENDFVFEVPVIFNAGVEGAEITPDEGGSSSTNNGLIDGNATITGDCVINGNLRLKGAGNYGNTIYFGDGSYAMISEPSDDTLTLKATNLNLNGSVSVNGGILTSGSWLPTLNNSSAVSSYSVQQGWYQRIGNVITIGWQLKATINSGYSSSSLSISGVPATPLYAAFGGGVAHNINVSAGFNFEGWTIDTSGNISPRTQPCNGTSAGNLQISSTAYYPSGSGNVLTLAGTICYVAN